jgi:acetyl-CoA synthetase
MIPDAAVAMLACARIGAVHSGRVRRFSPDSLAGASPIARPRS